MSNNSNVAQSCCSNVTSNPIKNDLINITKINCSKENPDNKVTLSSDLSNIAIGNCSKSQYLVNKVSKRCDFSNLAIKNRTISESGPVNILPENNLFTGAIPKLSKNVKNSVQGSSPLIFKDKTIIDREHDKILVESNLKSNISSLVESNVSFKDSVDDNKLNDRGESPSTKKPDRGQHQSSGVKGKIRQFEANKVKISRTPVKVISSKLTPKKHPKKSSSKGQSSSQKVTKDIRKYFPAEVQSENNVSQISKVSSGFVDLVKKVTNTKCESPLEQQQQHNVQAKVHNIMNNIESNLKFKRDLSHSNISNNYRSSESNHGSNVAIKGVVQSRKDAFEVLMGSKGGGTRLKTPGKRPKRLSNPLKTSKKLQ